MIKPGMVAAKGSGLTSRGIQPGAVAAKGGIEHQKYIASKKQKELKDTLIKELLPPKTPTSKVGAEYLKNYAAGKTVQKIKNNEYVTPAQIDSAAEHLKSKQNPGWAALRNPTVAEVSGKELAKQISGTKNYYSLFKGEEDFKNNKNERSLELLPIGERLIIDQTVANLQKGIILDEKQRNAVKKYGLSYILGQTPNQNAYFDFMSSDNPKYKSFSEKAKKIIDKKSKGETVSDEENEIVENFLLFEDLRRNEAKGLGRLTTERKTNSQNLNTTGAIQLYNDAAYGENRTTDRLGLYVNTGMQGYLQNTADAASIVLASIGGMGKQINEELSTRADSPYQIASNELRNYYKQNGQQFNIIVQDVITNMAQNAIPMMLGVVGGAGAKGSEALSKVLSTAAFAPSVFGGAYKEGLQSGIKDFGKLWAYSLATTATECTLEMLLGSDKNPAGGVLSGKVISSLGKNLEKVFLKGILNMAGNATGEFIEEGIQSILGPLFKEWFLGTEEKTILDNPIESLSNAAYEGFIGAVSATLMGGLSSFNQARAEIGLLQRGRLYKNVASQTGADIKNIAQFFKESFRDKAVKRAADKVIKGNTSDLSVGELLNAVMEYSKESSNVIFAAIGQNIQNVPNGINLILSTYTDMVESGAIFPYKVTELYDRINDNIANNEIDTSVIGEFAYYVEAYAPKANVLGKVIEAIKTTENNSQTPILQSSAESEESMPVDTAPEFTETEQQILNTPDEQLNPEQQTIKQDLIARQQAASSTPSGAEKSSAEGNLQSSAKGKITAEEQSKVREKIAEVSKKLDKDLNIVYVPRNSAELNGKKGKYVHDTKTMYLAEDLDTKEAYIEVFKHEFIHRLELRKDYVAFKNFLFNKSVAFGEYAKSRLRLFDEQNGRETVKRTREQAIQELTQMYLDNFKNDSTIEQSVRDNFTKEKAEREAVADFVARVLFKGNTTELRVALRDNEMFGFAELETNVDLLEELYQTNRPLYRRIIDAIRDFIRDIVGVHGVSQLKNEIDYLEKRLARVYDSADTKNTDGGVVYNKEKQFGDSLDIEGLEYDSESQSVFSADSWEESVYVKNKKTSAQKIANAIGVSERKAMQYINDINSIANKILDNYEKLGYDPSPDRSAFVSNAEYGGSIDMSTLCAKRRWLTGTFSAIQRALNHTALTANEILEIRNMLKEKGIEVSCGLCYVEGSRAQMGKFAKAFIERYKKRSPEWVPDMADVNTPEGVEKMRLEHPEAYKAYEEFWNNKGVLNEGEGNLFASQQKPKLYQLRTDYKHEILDKFSSEGNVTEKNKNGGLRIQSFSDFEIVHLIDMMQVIIDMSQVGLYGQAYTKVPDFALALGNTGLKINLSLIAKGVDSNGNLIFDDVEGMPFKTAMNIRNMYSENVGTVLVVFNDAQLKAALKDSRIDFVLPFHRSQWKKAMYNDLGLPANTKDYTYVQNEKYIKPVYYTTRNGTKGKRKAKNYMPNEYWDYTKSGKENAIDYLEKCAKENKRPKFYKFLVDNGDGSYSLQPDGSTDGYWKLLIDFKMYDNKGKGSPQVAVQPKFNMDECNRMLDEYEGGHEKFPVDQEVVDAFVGKYMKKKGEQKFTESTKSKVSKPSTKYDVSLSGDELYYSGSRGSENLFNTPDYLKPDSEREWSVFNRQFSNKTNNLKNGEKSNIIIYTADYAYLVVADGYMSGKIVNKFLIDGNEEIINDTIEEFRNGTFKPTKRIDSIIQSIRNERGRSRLGNALSSGSITTEINDFLDREEYGGDTVRSDSKSNVNKIKNEETFSSDDLDKDYLKAVENGDMETAQRLVDEVAKENEYSVKAYHGTSSGGFTVFDAYGGNFGLFGKGVYFTENKQVADSYQNKGKGTNKQTYSVFLSPKKILDMDATANIEAWKKAAPEASDYFENCITNEDCFRKLKEYCYDEEMIRWEAEEYITDVIQYNMGYNSITHIGGGRFNKKDDTRHRVYIVFEPDQIKSADPVTYDDNGNVIPLSKRFNVEDVDIRYSSDDIDTVTENKPREIVQEDINAQHDALLEKYENGFMSRDEYLAEMDGLYGKAVEQYGEFEKGEYDETKMPVPKSIAKDKPIERFARTFVGAAKLTPEMIEQFEADVLLGEFSYTVASDEKALEFANKVIANGNAETTWEDVVNGRHLPSKNDIAIGEKLLANAVDSNDIYATMKISAELADIFTRAGQVVQSARLLGKMTGAGRLVSAQRMVDTLNKDRRAKYGPDTPPIKISEDKGEALVKAKTKEGQEEAFSDIMDEVAAQTEVTWLDKWNAWRYFAMLCNPKTHIRNLLGNGIFVPTVIIKDAIATGFEKTFIKDTSNRTKTVIIKKEYWKFAYNDGKRDDVKALLKGNKYSDKSNLREYQKTFKTEALEFLTQFNSNALEVEDMIFKNVHYTHALAGFLQARKTDLSNVSEEVLMQARAYAVKEAKKATFNDESALANWIQNFGRKNLATNMMVEGILPFKRTPINIIKRGVEYSPMGLGKTLVKGSLDVKKGKITPSEFIDGLASGLTGTGIMLVGMLLANMGIVNGGDDEDKKSQFEKWLGKQEYSIEFFGKSYTVDWAAPACIPFFIGAEIVNSVKDSEDFQFSQLGNAVWNSLEPITNLSMLSGLQSTIEATRYADDSQVLSSMVGDTITTYAMQGAPSILGAVARTIDSKQRSWYTDKNSKWFDPFTQSVGNNIRSKIPGLTFTQIPKIDPWGREVSRGNVGERILENFISPGYYSKLEYDKTSDELKRLFVKTGENVFPATAAKSFEVDNKTKQLTAEEYVTYAKAKGNYSFDYIQEFLNSSAYSKLTDDERADVITNLYKLANAKAKGTVSEYNPAEINTYKTVIKWEQNGRSAVNYYIYRATNK